MKLYFAGSLRGYEDFIYNCGVRNRLLTFADKDNWAKDAFEVWIDKKTEDVSVFLDSGAFSAWSRDVELSLPAYCQYILQHKDQLDIYCNLDVIGNWKGSARNLDKMLQNELRPMAVFHRNSPWNELDRLGKLAIELGLPLAMGGLVGGGKSVTAGNIQEYLDQCWARLRKYWPLRVHVFGIVAQWVLERYPWYSADSSSAVVSGGLGHVKVWEKGKLTTEPWVQHAQRTMNGKVVDGVSRDRAKNGSAHLGRRRQNMLCQLLIERHVTSLWANRGVTWEKDQYTGTL